MKGFDPTFADLPDYIIKITKEIWEDRDFDPERLLRRRYRRALAEWSRCR